MTAETLTSRVWLLLLAEGGWWSPQEVAGRLNAANKHVGQLLRGMVDAGSVKTRNRAEYGVTSECRVPRCITLAELEKAGRVV